MSYKYLQLLRKKKRYFPDYFTVAPDDEQNLACDPDNFCEISMIQFFEVIPHGTITERIFSGWSPFADAEYKFLLFSVNHKQNKHSSMECGELGKNCAVYKEDG